MHKHVNISSWGATENLLLKLWMFSCICHYGLAAHTRFDVLLMYSNKGTDYKNGEI